MNSHRIVILFISLCAFIGRASDEVQGTVSEILLSIKNRNVGKVYVLNAQIASPPFANNTCFIVRDETGSIVIRRDYDWPEPNFLMGDIVRLRCELNSTASTPAAAYFRNMVLISHGASDTDARGSWLVTTQDDESANVFKLPKFMTKANITLALIGIVSLFLIVLAWNTLLRRLIDRRSRELTEERLAAFVSTLKVEERTRLAIELHDTIAQMLKGISLEIDAARDFARTSPHEMERHLSIATQAISSCQSDLRNCIWDLRHQTLDDDMLDIAIRRTLLPHLGKAELSVRFAVRREILTDNTALAILRIIRELTLNALRHGNATAIKVTGDLKKKSLHFSVEDNGCGFNPENAPSISQGHFGLQGIEERVESLGGTLTINSSPGLGTCTNISIPLSRSHTDTHEENQNSNC